MIVLILNLYKIKVKTSVQVSMCSLTAHDLLAVHSNTIMNFQHYKPKIFESVYFCIQASSASEYIIDKLHDYLFLLVPTALNIMMRKAYGVWIHYHPGIITCWLKEVAMTIPQGQLNETGSSPLTLHFRQSTRFVLRKSCKKSF